MGEVADVADLSALAASDPIGISEGSDATEIGLPVDVLGGVIIRASEVPMRIRVFAIAVLWALSLVGVSLWAQVRPALPSEIRRPGDPDGPVITGANIGFQPVVSGISGDRNKVAGRGVVRIDGQWRETTGPIAVQQAVVSSNSGARIPHD